MEENKIDVLEMMAQNERLVSDLYKIYSEKFPEYKDFWVGLGVEETDHYIWITELGKKVKDGSVSFDENRFNLRTIKNFRGYMNDLLDASQKQEITLESAVSNALNIEIALIERKFFEVFDADAKELKEVLKLLSISTKKHVERVRELWNKIKGN